MAIDPRTKDGQIVDLNFGSPEESQKQLCTECWLRVHKDMFGPTDDKCLDCREMLGEA